jgi:hypothetical protein
MRALCSLFLLIVAFLAGLPAFSIALPDSDELAAFFPEEDGFGSDLEDVDYGLEVVSNDIGFWASAAVPDLEMVDSKVSSNEMVNSDLRPIAEENLLFPSEDTFYLPDDMLVSWDSHFPSSIAQAAPAGDGSSLEFNDNTPDENLGLPQCNFPTFLQCCPPGKFFQCRPWFFQDPQCQKVDNIYCCQNNLLKNDEGDPLGWEFVCDKSVVWKKTIWDQVWDFLESPVHNPVNDLLDWIPPGLLGPAGENQWGVGT